MVSVIVDRDLEDLIPGYLSNRERDVAKVAEALAAGDFETLRVIGHSMKGSGGGYGFDALSDLGSQIEQAALARNAEAVRMANAELRSYLQQVEVVYR